MKSTLQSLKIGILLFFSYQLNAQNISYPIVDTGVHEFYNNSAIISQPSLGNAFYGQDACYMGNQPSYTNNGNGTITDNVTGLIWQQDMGTKITYSEAFTKADTMLLGGFSDWRVPTIKELYSLIQFTGQVQGQTAIKMFIDTDYFIQPLGDTSLGEREIDAQTWSSTQYKGLTMNGDSTVFGVNFIDGRIKGYPKYVPGTHNSSARKMYFRMVRGNTEYGKNNFVNNNNGTITDNATGLMWQQADDGVARDWQSALSYAENLTLAGYSDWRLPNAKELQSLVDYNRCPTYTHSAAIDPIFSTTMINDPDGVSGQYPYFWTGTTHLDGVNPHSGAVYVAFGEAQGKMNGNLLDVHGAGAQRSDPKSGNAADYPQFFGPQGDVRYVYNYVRCVRDASAKTSTNELKNNNLPTIYPNPVNDICTLNLNKVYEKVNVDIYNSLGEKVKEYKIFNTDLTVLNLSDISDNILILNVYSEQNLLSERIVKL